MSSIPDALRSFADSYTEAWCSQHPEKVADHYSPSGSLCINADIPAVGRGAITEVAKSVMTAFPDMQIRMDRLALGGEHIEYHWTLLGTNTGPRGTGRRVAIGGFELWRIGGDGLIEESQGHFDARLYQHQLEHGI